MRGKYTVSGLKQVFVIGNDFRTLSGKRKVELVVLGFQALDGWQDL